MKVRMSHTVLACAAAVAATVTLAAAPALARTMAPATTPRPALVTAHGSVRPADDCPWLVIENGVTIELGTVICEYLPGPTVGFPNGTEETFAIGTSHAIWTAWDNTAGTWAEASLGGLGYSAPWIVTQNGWGLTLGVSSSSGGHYCDNREDSPSGGWTGWFKC